MAGIGFRLQKLLSQEDLSSSVKAYAYAAIVIAGPFLLTVALLCGIHRITLDDLTAFNQSYLKTLIAYGIAFSLVSTGPVSLVLTRFVADEHYRGHVTHLTSVYLSTVALHALAWGGPVALYLSRLSVSSSVKLAALLMFVFASGNWYAMVFLSAAEDYIRVVRAVFLGTLASGLAAFALGRASGLPGYFSGFVLGQGLSFFLLSWAVLAEFGHEEPRDFSWLRYFRKFPCLIGIGLFYNLGIWADKFLFWASRESEGLDFMFRHCPVYDAPMFFAYLTIIPSLVYFLIQMETDFFLKYKAYYQGIERKESLQALEDRRQTIVATLERSLRRLFVLQGIISWVCLLAVPWMTQVARLDPIQMGILRTGILASFLQAGFLIALNLLLYFDFQKEALLCTAVFCGLNALLTRLSLSYGLPAFGYGYTCACFIGLACALYFINERLRLLHYWTFMRQPIPQPIIVSEDLAEDDALAEGDSTVPAS